LSAAKGAANQWGTLVEKFAGCLFSKRRLSEKKRKKKQPENFRLFFYGAINFLTLLF